MSSRALVACFVMFASLPALAQQADGGTGIEGAPLPGLPTARTADGGVETPGHQAAPSPSPNHAPTPPVLTAGARLGYGLPFGHWTGDTRAERSGLLADVFADVYAFQMEAAYRFAATIGVGLYGQLAPARLQYTCVGGSCSARNVRAGVLLVFRPPTFMKWSVFLTPELGYASTDFTAEAEDASLRMDVSYRGFDATLTVGADYPVAGRSRLGFYFFARGGTYLWRSVRLFSDGFEVLPRPSVHGFLGFGVRGEYAIF